MVKKDALLRKANIKKKEKKNNNNFSIKFVEFSQNKASRGLVNTIGFEELGVYLKCQFGDYNESSNISKICFCRHYTWMRPII